MSIQLHLETTAACNANCVFCERPMVKGVRVSGTMSMPLYYKIMDEAGIRDHISAIAFSGLGEPALDPHLETRIAYARLKKPEAFIELFTNGVLMTPTLFSRVRDAGIDSISFSLNAVRQEQHEARMLLKGKFDLVCSHIDYAIKHHGKVQVNVKAAVAPDFWTPEDTQAFYRRWGHRRVGGHGLQVLESNWAGATRTIHGFDPNEACGRALEQIAVAWDGKVIQCCFDPTGKVVFGNLNTQTMKEVYDSPKYQEFREDHFNNQAAKHELCKVCARI